MSTTRYYYAYAPTIQSRPGPASSVYAAKGYALATTLECLGWAFPGLSWGPGPQMEWWPTDLLPFELRESVIFSGFCPLYYAEVLVGVILKREHT